MIGCLYGVAFPFRNPKSDYFKFTCVKCVLLLMLCLVRVVDGNRLFVSVLMVGLGFLKVQISCLYYIAGNSFLI